MRQWRLAHRAVRSAFARAHADERGLGLAETIAALSIFLIIAVSLEGVLVSGVAGHSVAQHRTLAEQIAVDQVESVRVLPYDSVGTVSGNPPGTVARTRSVTVEGLNFTVRTRIRYVNDPVPGSFATQANYKRVTVWVTRAGELRELARQETFVAPAVRPSFGGANWGIIRATVRDYVLNTLMPDVTVALAAGPSAPRDDTTDATGIAVFPGLTPTTGAQYYDVTAAYAGYVTLKDDAPPSPAGRFTVAAGQLVDTTLRMYKPATINVSVYDGAGGPLYSGNATVTIKSSRGVQEFSFTGGFLSITTLNGEPVVPGLQYTVGARAGGNKFAQSVTQTVPPSYPTNLISNFSLTLETYSFGILRARVRNSSGSNIANARVDMSGGPVGILITGVTNGSGQFQTQVPRGATPYNTWALDPATGNTGSGTPTAVTSGGTFTVNITVIPGG